MGRKILSLTIILVLALVSISVVATVQEARGSRSQGHKGKAQGHTKFQLEGSVVDTGTASLVVLARSGSGRVSKLKGITVSIEVKDSTIVRRKGKRIALSDIFNGDRVFVRGGMQTINQVPIDLSATNITVKPARKHHD